jgi:hypothetical protein
MTPLWSLRGGIYVPAMPSGPRPILQSKCQPCDWPCWVHDGLTSSVHQCQLVVHFGPNHLDCQRDCGSHCRGICYLFHTLAPTGRGTGLSLQLSTVQPEVPLRPKTIRLRGPVPSVQKPIHVAAGEINLQSVARAQWLVPMLRLLGSRRWMIRWRISAPPAD